MTAVLGIDAAWTAGNPSGVALAAETAGGWRCLAVAPGYGLFCDLAAGRIAPDDQWGPKPAGGTADVPALLAACRALLVREGLPPAVDAVAVDMPLSPTPLTGRRPAEDAAARALGRYACGVHSPCPGRPGELGAALTRAFAEQGFALAVCDGRFPKPALLEVYPHAVCIGLQLAHAGVPQRQVRRLAYKISRSSGYWPRTTVRERVGLLCRQFATLRDWLGHEVAIPAFPVPEPRPGLTLAGLKPYEDGLDALACCAMGIRYLEGRATCLGDAAGAIWVPDTV